MLPWVAHWDTVYGICLRERELAVLSLDSTYNAQPAWHTPPAAAATQPDAPNTPLQGKTATNDTNSPAGSPLRDRKVTVSGIDVV